MPQHLAWAACILAAALLPACSTATSEPPTATCNLASLTLTGPSSVTVGQTITLAYTAVQNTGSSCSAAQLAGSAWSSDAITVAFVEQTGVVSGVSAGGAVISVALLGRTATQPIQVNPTPVATITITPAAPSLNVGQSVTLVASCQDGRVPPQNTPCGTVVWSMIPNPVATISASGLVAALAPGNATATATVGSITKTALITVNQLPPAATSRIAYALTDQPLVAAPTTQFNSLGGTITVTRSGTGQYTVSIPGFSGATGDSRIPFVNAVNAAGVVCLPIDWNMIGGIDATVQVNCSTANGTLVDSRFAIFAIGQGGLPGRLAFAHSGTLPPLGSTAPVTLGSASAWSSSGLPPQVSRFDNTGAGRFTLALRLPFATSPDVPVVGPARSNSARCSVSGWGPSQDIPCYPVGSATFGDAAFSGMFLDQGRAGKRFGAVHPSLAAVSRNSAGGSNLVVATGAGTSRVTFPNLGRPTGGAEVVLVTAHALFSAAHCNPVAWNTVGNDLVVDVACFNGAGVLTTSDFIIVVIE